MIKGIITRISGTTTYNGIAVDRVAFWTFCLVLATLFLLWIAKKQLGGISKTAKADFILRFTEQFFGEETRDIIMLFDYGALKFQNAYVEYSENIEPKLFPYFVIDEGIVSQLKINPEKQQKILKRKYYSPFEIDDFLIGYFEDLGSYERKALIDIEGIYDGFSWYIGIIWKNEEIQKFIKSQKNEIYGDIGVSFKYIYEKIDSYSKAKSAGELMWWWKIKWFIKNRFFAALRMTSTLNPSP